MCGIAIKEKNMQIISTLNSYPYNQKFTWDEQQEPQQVFLSWSGSSRLEGLARDGFFSFGSKGSALARLRTWRRDSTRLRMRSCIYAFEHLI